MLCVYDVMYVDDMMCVAQPLMVAALEGHAEMVRWHEDRSRNNCGSDLV